MQTPTTLSLAGRLVRIAIITLAADAVCSAACTITGRHFSKTAVIATAAAPMYAAAFDTTTSSNVSQTANVATG